MTNFTVIFGLAFALNAVVTYMSSDLFKRNKAAATGNADERALHQKLLRTYLPVYLLATLSDWLQGPYVYALYSAYKYSQHDIAVLFVAGFGSSMVFGSFIGGMADWGGRRNFVVLFAVIYSLSCLTKHFKYFYVLMLGRLLGGIATSLLFSVFDAWLIRAHNDRKLKNYISKSFSWAAYGNSLIAIAAGLVADKVASYTAMREASDGMYLGGYLGPFDLALVALVMCGGLAVTRWEENYGDTEENDKQSDEHHQTWYDGLRLAFTTTVRSQDILLCGIISSLFEGSMYIFVFMWTPALTAGSDDALPFGLVFSTFMVCCMAGSSFFSIQSEKMKPETLGIFVFGAGAVAMALVAVSPSNTLKFIAMNAFEMTVGMYWPIMGTQKSAIVPESKRAAIYNLYRIPLNCIVLFSLLTDLSPTTSFILNAFMLATACVLQMMLNKNREHHGLTGDKTSRDNEGELLLASQEKLDSSV